MILTNPVINVDKVFQVLKNCSWNHKGYISGDIEVQDWLGGLHINAIYRKEIFQLQFNNLNQQLTDLLEQIFLQTGVNVFHIVEVVTPNKRRIWDGVTSPSGGTNTDINRVRNKVYLRSFTKTNYDGNPNIYQVTIE